jgi:hypothetical protein
MRPIAQLEALYADLRKARRNEKNKLPGDVLKTYTWRGQTRTYWGPPDTPKEGRGKARGTKTHVSRSSAT